MQPSETSAIRPIALNHLVAPTTPDGRVVGGVEVARVVRRTIAVFEDSLVDAWYAQLHYFADQIEKVSISPDVASTRRSSPNVHDLKGHMGGVRLPFAALYLPLYEDLSILDPLKLILLLLCACRESSRHQFKAIADDLSRRLLYDKLTDSTFDLAEDVAALLLQEQHTTDERAGQLRSLFDRLVGAERDQSAHAAEHVFQILGKDAHLARTDKPRREPRDSVKRPRTARVRIDDLHFRHRASSRPVVIEESGIVDYPAPADLPAEDARTEIPSLPADMVTADMFDSEDAAASAADRVLDQLSTESSRQFELYTRRRGNWFWFFGPVLTDSEQVLTSDEYKQVMSELLSNLPKQQPSSALLSDVAQNLVLAISALTTRTLQESRDALIAFVRRNEGKAGQRRFSLNELGWTILHPVDALPAVTPLDEDWWERTTDRLFVPWPREVCLALQVLVKGSRRPADRHALAKDLVVALEASNVFEDLKRRVPRLSQGRLARFLIADVYRRTGHPREWMLIFGVDGYLSKAPLHYVAADPDALRELYRQAVADAGIQLVDAPDPFGGVRYGAPKGGLRFDRIARAIFEQRTALEACGSPKRMTVARRVEYFNQLTAFAALWFMAATAHRATGAIGAFTRRDLHTVCSSDSRGPVTLAVVYDKGHSAAVESRQCVLPANLVELLETVIQTASVLYQQLLTEGSGRWSPAKDQLSRLLSGDGPLFVGLDSASGTAEKMSRALLAQRWPNSVPVPVFLRHVFASHVGRFGMTGADTAQLMGHRIDGLPFDAHDPDDPIRFAHRVRPALEGYLSALGFELPRNPTRAPELPLLNWRAILRMNADDQQAVRHLSQLVRVSQADRVAATSRVAEWQADRVQAMEGDVRGNPQPSAIQEVVKTFLADWQEETPARQIALYDALLEAAKHHPELKAAQLKSRISPPETFPPRLSAIRRVHLEAFRWLETLITQLRKSPSTERPTADSRMILQVCAVALGGGGCSEGRLGRLFDTRTELLRRAGPNGVLVAKMPMRVAGGDDRAEFEAFVIPSVIEAPVLGLFEHLKQSPSGQLEQDFLHAVARWQPVCDLPLPSSWSQWLHIFQLARALLSSGSGLAFESGVLASVGLHPDCMADLLGVGVSTKADTGATSSGTAVQGYASNHSGQSSAVNSQRKIVLGALTALSERPVTKKRLDSLADAVGDLLDATESGSLHRAVALAIDRNRLSSKLMWSTVRQYVYTLGPLLNHCDGSPLSPSVQEELADTFRALLLKKQGGGDRQNQEGVLSAFHWLQLSFDAAGVELDLEDVFEDFDPETRRPPGYLLSDRQVAAQHEQLIHWLDLQTEAEGLTVDLAKIKAMAVAHLMLRKTALRIGELAGLKLRCVAVSQNKLSVNVQSRRARSLKTRASRRVITAPLSDVEAAFMTQFLRDRYKAEGDNEELFSQQVAASIPDVRKLLGEGVTELAAEMIPAIANRSHAFRHRYATSWGLALAEQRPESTGYPLSLADAPDLGGLPGRVRYQYGSRRLGHGSPDTTFCWYDHSLSLRRDTLTLAGLAEPASQEWLLTHTRSRHRGIHRERRLRRLLAESAQTLDGLEVSEFKPTATLPDVLQGRAGRYLGIGKALLALRKFADDEVVSAVTGLPMDRVAALRKTALGIQGSYGLRFLPRPDSPEPPRRRLPLAMHVMPLLDEWDRLVKSYKVSTKDFETWIWSGLAQRKQPSQVLARSDHPEIEASLRWFAGHDLKRGAELKGKSADLLVMTIIAAGGAGSDGH